MYPDRGPEDDEDKNCCTKFFEDEETIIAIIIYSILTRSGFKNINKDPGNS